MSASPFDFKSCWLRAVSVMEGVGMDALFLMKPANLVYLTGDGRPCALGLLTRSLRCIVAVPSSDLDSVRKTSAATDIRVFHSEEEMFQRVPGCPARPGVFLVQLLDFPVQVELERGTGHRGRVWSLMVGRGVPGIRHR